MHAEDGLGNLAAVALNEEGDSIESPLTKALKHDLRWLQVSNSKYAQICNYFVTRYFLELGADPGKSIRASDLIHVDAIRLSKNHDKMIRFPNADDKDFRVVSECLVAMVSEATKSILGVSQAFIN
jgi:hypothetical protein